MQISKSTGKGKSMMSKYSNVTVENHIAVLEIDHAPANALSSHVIQELRDEVKKLGEQDDVHAIIITGKGRFFVAGADIKEFIPAMGSDENGLNMAKAGQALCDEIEALRKPVIAAVNGPALGGGLEIALGCHVRLASEKAILGLPELNLGLIPAFGGTQRLARLTNEAVALDLILSGRHISAAEAKDLHIVQYVVPGEELLDKAKEVAASYVSTHSNTSISRAMKAVQEGLATTLEEGLKVEREMFAELFLTEDAKEGVTAFSEKRAAEFKHK